MSIEYLPAVVALGLFVGMLLCGEAGRIAGHRWQERQGAEPQSEFTAVDGALFGLMGLLIAFTFAGAANRFDERRDLIREEANAIGTAYLRLDLLRPDRRSDLQAEFVAYLEARLDAYRDVTDAEAVAAAVARYEALQRDIWTKAVAATAETGSISATTLLLSALNEMIDITTTRTVATQKHPPLVIYVMLIAFALISSFHAGFGMAGARRRSLVHALGFAGTVALSVFVIMDLEYPRIGFFTIEASDEILRGVGAGWAAVKPP